MTMLIVQTLILMAVAFGVGCLAGCWFRGRAGGGQKAQSDAGGVRTVHKDVAPAMTAAVADPAVAEPSGQPAGAAVETARISAAEPAAVKAKASKAAPNKAATRKPAAKRSSVSKPATAKPAAQGAASATAATAGAPAAKPKAATPAAKSKAVKTGSAAADDLKKIKGIGPQNEIKLRAAGITSFAQIAGWNKAEEAEIGERLAFAGRIEREDWVAQAKILAKGGETDFSRRTGKNDLTGTPDGSGKSGGKKRS